MSADYIYLSTQLKFKESGAKDINGVFRTDSSGNIILKNKNLYYEHFTKEQVMNHIQALQNYAKTNKLHITGYATVAIFQGNSINYQNLKVSLKKVTEIVTDVKISSKSTSGTTKKAKKTNDEKIELIRRFFTENKRLPNPSEMYEDEKIGAFVQKMKEEKALYDKIMSFAQ